MNRRGLEKRIERLEAQMVTLPATAAEREAITGERLRAGALTRPEFRYLYRQHRDELRAQLLELSVSIAVDLTAGTLTAPDRLNTYQMGPWLLAGWILALPEGMKEQRQGMVEHLRIWRGSSRPTDRTSAIRRDEEATTWATATFLMMLLKREGEALHQQIRQQAEDRLASQNQTEAATTSPE
jgi:hypothetical protein